MGACEVRRPELTTAGAFRRICGPAFNPCCQPKPPIPMADAPGSRTGSCWTASSTSCAPAVSRRPSPGSLAPPAPSMTASNSGGRLGYLSGCGGRVCWSPTPWRALTGNGNPWTGPWPRPLWGGEATGRNPTDRGKLGVKRSLLTEGEGIPIGIAVDGANRHDMKLVSATLESMVIDRPEPTEQRPQHICLDKGV